MSTVEVAYRIRGSRAEAEARARFIAYEQTVELPEHLVPESIRRTVVGQMEDLVPDEGHDGWIATLHFDSDLACGQLSQLMNLVYGNVSLLPDVRVSRLGLPDGLLATLPGPRYGEEGLRRQVGVAGRPLLMTAIKPRGLSVAQLAALAADFAAGGGDVVKDDQNLNDATYERWYERVARCAEAVQAANATHGTRCQYAPHLAGPPHELERRARAVRSLGLRGVLVSPMILGLDATAALGREHDLFLLGHPAASGGPIAGSDHGMEPHLLLGTLFRLAGADVSIFPNSGGRFGFSGEQAHAIARALQEPLGRHRPSLPAPAGGMDFGRIDDMAEAYGEASVFLVGGALLGGEDGVTVSTRRFLERLRERFDEITIDTDDVVSACELRDTTVADAVQSLLAHQPGFEWEGRTSTRYKDSVELPFRGVRRVELVGRQGERTAFDLRYFEVDPGGYTSLEKHVHTHTVIGVRGHGVLLRGDERTEVNPHDVAYVGSLEVHQLRNEGDEPFGFYCIVDHERDRPQAP